MCQGGIWWEGRVGAVPILHPHERPRPVQGLQVPLLHIYASYAFKGPLPLLPLPLFVALPSSFDALKHSALANASLRLMCQLL